MTQFDIILSNPPFQDSTARKKTPHKLWIDFTLAEVNRWLKPGGTLYQVSPSSFLSPSSKILPLFCKHVTPYVNLSIGHHFPQVGSTFAAYIVQNTPVETSKKEKTSFVTPAGDELDVLLDGEVLYLPNDLSKESLGIHRKVVFDASEHLPVQFDYVTHHNIVLKRDASTLSKTQTDEHVNPVFHTNSQVWWSSLRQPFADLPKVMWTRSGYTKPFYDEGVHGTTDMGYYILVEDAAEGEALAGALSLDLFKYVFATAKWSGFGNEIVFRHLPALPKKQVFTNESLFDFFGLDDAERDYVTKYVQKQLPKQAIVDGTEEPLDGVWKRIEVEANSHAYMASIERTAERVKASAEVFTPTRLVIDLIRQLPLDQFAPGKTVLDPAVGDGQFLIVARLIKQHVFGMTAEEAAADLYGVDIMVDNVTLARQRIGGGTILVGNALKPDAEIAGQAPEDAAMMKQLFSH